MISYRDMTFCKEENCKQFGDGKCFRSLTEKVHIDAQNWWGHAGGMGAPIAVFSNTPSCYEEKDIIIVPILGSKEAK